MQRRQGITLLAGPRYALIAANRSTMLCPPYLGLDSPLQDRRNRPAEEAHVRKKTCRCNRRRQCRRIHRLRTVPRHQAHDGGPLRLCAPARRDLRLSRPPRLRPLLFRAEGRQVEDRGGHLEGRVFRSRLQARGGAGGDRHRQHHHLPRQLEISDRHRGAGAGGHRRAHGAAGGAQEKARRRGAVRRDAQTRAALPAAASSASSPRPPAPSSATCCTASTSASRRT